MRIWFLAVLCSCTCPRAPAPEKAWPEFPASSAARAALITESTRRAAVASPEVTPERVFLEAERLGWSTLPSGDEGEAQPGIRVSATSAGTFKVDSQSVELAEAEVRLSVEPGAHTYCFESRGVRVVGSVLIPVRGEVELALDVPARSTRMVELGPAFP